ncbi:MAG: nucleotidyltransferase domain-containing protein [Defluviitaleaceae bacterium]|nr:nucleotidyltransferase domain-containing protein [Defluviitaleaceae bacterium]
MNNLGLPEDVFSEIKNVLSQFTEIESTKIFGSRAKGNFKRYSDIDIAIFSSSENDLSSSVKDALEELYVVYNFDVIHYEKCNNADIKEHIDRVGVVF